jgi:segregation and condensation protein B
VVGNGAVEEKKVASTAIISSIDVSSIIEALLFVSDEPLSVDKLLEVFDGVDRGAMCQIVEELRVRFNSNGKPFVLREINGGFQLCTDPKYAPWIKKLSSVRGNSKLSRAALETLAIVAYRQPVTRAEVESIRGVSCSGVLSSLLDRKLIRIAGRHDAPGKPLLYRTTQEFMQHFGLRSIKDLPRISELKELC